MRSHFCFLVAFVHRLVHQAIPEVAAAEGDDAVVEVAASDDAASSHVPCADAVCLSSLAAPAVAPIVNPSAMVLAARQLFNGRKQTAALMPPRPIPSEPAPCLPPASSAAIPSNPAVSDVRVNDIGGHPSQPHNAERLVYVAQAVTEPLSKKRKQPSGVGVYLGALLPTASSAAIPSSHAVSKVRVNDDGEQQSQPQNAKERVAQAAAVAVSSKRKDPSVSADVPPTSLLANAVKHQRSVKDMASIGRAAHSVKAHKHRVEQTAARSAANYQSIMNGCRVDGKRQRRIPHSRHLDSQLD
jgi:hypothetical protein